MRTRLDLLHPNLSQDLHTKQSNQKHYHDRHAKDRTISVGQKVMARNYRGESAWVPATVTQKVGSRAFLVCVTNGQIWKRHIDQLKVIDTTESQMECESRQYTL